jgi:hypothetical protein
MGKREFLIVVAFVAVGAIAYHLTAPPAKSGQQGFSFARFFNNARRGVTQDRANATVTLTGTFDVGASVTDLRVSNIQQTVQIIGEARSNVAYEFTVDSTGPDEATAKIWAARSVLKPDDLGTTLALAPTYPAEGRQMGKLRLHVPARMNVRVDGSTGVRVSGVAGARLEGVTGDVNVEQVVGIVRGSHRNGNLTITGAGGAALTLQNSTATFERLTDRLTLTARGSHCRVSDSKGSIDIDETNTDISITAHAGPVRISGTGGSVTVSDPRAETNIDVRRAEVEVTLLGAVPLTLVTTDESLRLLVGGSASGAIDAIATDRGEIQAKEFNVTAETSADERRLALTLGGGAHASRVVLRNQRGDIVIRKAK